MNATRGMHVLGSTLTTLFFVNAAMGQSQLHLFSGDAPGELHGTSVAGIGDVNVDNFEDLIVGAIHAGIGGRARVYSGLSGAVLYEHLGASDDDAFGLAVGGLGDLNGDGVPDYAVGAPGYDTSLSQAGSLYVYSGADGTLLYQMVGGMALERLGTSFSSLDDDLDGDGVDDFVVGAPGHSGAGEFAGAVHVVSGRTGDRLYKVLGPGAHSQLGVSVAGLGDLDGDGRVEFVVGTLKGFGGAYIYSGATGSLHHVILGSSWNSWFGWSVANAGDTNGDGYTDVLVGAPEDSTLFARGGSAWLFSGSNFSVLHSIYGQRTNTFLGTQVVGLGDLDGDGHGDFAVTVPGDHPLNSTSLPPGGARVYSGFGGSQLAAFWGLAPDARMRAVAPAGDVNQDGIPDIIFGANAANTAGNQAGAAWVVSGVPCWQVDSFCMTSPNSVGSGAVMSSMSIPSISQNGFVLTCDSVPANTMGMFFYSNYQGFSTFGNGIRCLNSPIARLGIVQAQGSTFSYALDVTQPPSPADQIGPWTPWYFQCWYRDPQAGPAYFNLSDGLRIVFCE